MKNEKVVTDFIRECSAVIGNMENEYFSIDLFCFCVESKLESPLEKILYCALKTVARSLGLPEACPVETENGWFIRGLEITPQFKIDKYRVDFFIYFGFADRKTRKEVIVECDSQQFHERTEEERRYEKERDRYLIKKEYKTFHFTGKEILSKPFEVAAEIISYLTGKEINETLEVVEIYREEK